jgi:hypothetical protein
LVAGVGFGLLQFLLALLGHRLRGLQADDVAAIEDQLRSRCTPALAFHGRPNCAADELRALTRGEEIRDQLRGHIDEVLELNLAD